MPQLLTYEEAIRRLEELGGVQVEQGAATTREQLRGLSGDLFSIEIGAGLEGALAAFLATRYPTPELTRAFELQYPGLAQSTTLTEHYEALLERGAESTDGFVHALRGKLFEIRLPDELAERFPGFEFTLSESATEPGWDLVGHNEAGVEILVQAKARAASAMSDVVDAMTTDGAPEHFAVTRDLFQAISDAHPELVDRLVEIDVSSFALDETVEKALATLAEGIGLYVPDVLTEAIPYAGELVLGIRLIVDVIRNESALREMPISDRSRLHAVRALTLMTRFGVSTVTTMLGGAAGSVVPGWGTLVGILIGAFSAALINGRLQPHMLDLGLDLAGVDRNDLFYFQHKAAIERIAERLAAQAADAQTLLAAA